MPLPLGPTTATNRPRGSGLTETGDEPLDEPFAAVEVDGIVDVERPQSLVRVVDLDVGCGGGRSRCCRNTAERFTEIGDEGGHTFVALRGVDVGGAVDDAQNGRWQCAANLGDLTTQTGECLGDDDTEAVDVRRRCRLAAIEPIGRRVRSVECRSGRRSVGCPTVRPDGDAEIRQERVAIVVDEDVGRLDVAVDDARAVGRLQRAAELIDHRGGLRGAQGAVFEHRRQAPASHQPHHEVRRAGLAPVVVERDDVRVLELGDQLRLGLEATDEVGVVGVLRSDDLDRHLTADGGLIGAVRDPAGPVADPLAQFVPTDRETWLGRGARHRDA